MTNFEQSDGSPQEPTPSRSPDASASSTGKSGFNPDRYKEQLTDAADNLAQSATDAADNLAQSASNAADSIAESANSAWQMLKKVAVTAAGIMVVGLIAAATIPNWWAHRLGDVIDQKYSTGLPLGLVLGFVCTFVPLALLAWGFGRRSSGTNLLWFAIPALLIALPNLATLWISIGVGNGAEAGRNTLDVDGPGVRGGTLMGALAGLAAFAGWQYAKWTRHKADAEAEQRRVEAAQTSYAPPR